MAEYCPACGGAGYTLEIRPACCGQTDSECRGDCCVPEEYQEQCGACCGTGESQ